MAENLETDVARPHRPPRFSATATGLCQLDVSRYHDLDSVAVTDGGWAVPTAPCTWRSTSPRGAKEWVVHLEIWRPSLDAWRTLTVATVPAGTTSTVFREGVENDRRYRVQAAVHQGRGWSRWSEAREVLGTPEAPGLRSLQWKKQKIKKKSYLHYGWERPEELGSPCAG